MTTYNYEYSPDEKIRLAHVGCGGHSFRNILPCYQYAPVELVAVCDTDGSRAAAFARQFGATSHFTDLKAMLAKCDLDAVVIVTGYDDQGVTHCRLAVDVLQAGCHVLVEKPPANNVAEVIQLQSAEAESGKFAMVACKKAFFPAIHKAKQIVMQDEFGALSSLYARYPQALPHGMSDRVDPMKMRGFLDHVVHPGSILYYLGGQMESLRFSIDRAGGSVGTIRFTSGALGALHLVSGASGTSPLERLEVVGQGANLVVDNGVRLTYYRPGGRGEGGYGRSGDFIGPDDGAPIVWEPEFSLGQLYNKGLFMLGYVPEVLYFCECVAAGRRPELANSDWAMALTGLYEAYLGQEDTTIPI